MVFPYSFLSSSDLYLNCFFEFFFFFSLVYLLPVQNLMFEQVVYTVSNIVCAGDHNGGSTQNIYFGAIFFLLLTKLTLDLCIFNHTRGTKSVCVHDLLIKFCSYILV